jgi:hypothetical protein
VHGVLRRAAIGTAALVVATGAIAPVVAASRASGATLTPSDSVTTDESPRGVVAATLDGDRRLDLAIASLSSDVVDVALGRPGGGFDPVVAYPTGDGPASLAVGDLDGDGGVDVVTADAGDGTVGVLLGLGDGRLRPATLVPIGGVPNDIAVADVDRDRDLDIVVTDVATDRVVILRNDGTGGFPTSIDVTVPGGPFAVAVGTDQHREPVLAVTQAFTSSGAILVRREASFALVDTIGVGGFPSDVVLDDLDGDHRLDVAATSFDDGRLWVASGRRDGTFATPISALIGTNAYGVIAFRPGLGRDPILAAADRTGGSVSIVRAGDDLIIESTVTGLPCPNAFAAGPFDGDRWTDLAVADLCGSEVRILRSDP